MGSRRDFLTALPAGAAGFMFANACTGPQTVSAQAAPRAGLPALPANIIYAVGDEGVWSGKAGSHAPSVVVDKNTGKATVMTKHGMKEGHYIVRHTLVSANGDALHGHTFSPTDPEATSVADLGEKLQGLEMMYAFSFCNLHDLWVAEVKI